MGKFINIAECTRRAIYNEDLLSYFMLEFSQVYKIIKQMSKILFQIAPTQRTKHLNIYHSRYLISLWIFHLSIANLIVIHQEKIRFPSSRKKQCEIGTVVRLASSSKMARRSAQIGGKWTWTVQWLTCGRVFICLPINTFHTSSPLWSM
jgi:hypothetical protein